MHLEYKNTLYTPIFKITDNHEGLGDNDFWIDIDFTLENEDIKYKGIIPGMSFQELIKWNIMNFNFINGIMKENESIKFIRRLGELLYYPKEGIVEKRLFLYDDVNKYYAIYFNKKEMEEIFKINKEFIEKYLNL